MQHEQGPQFRGSIPRLSKLPTARASNDPLITLKPAQSRENLYQESLTRIPGLQRPSSSSQHQNLARSPSPLGENINRSFISRFGWPQATSHTKPKHSPVREVFSPVGEKTLDSTPPSSIPQPLVYEDGDENSSAAQHVVAGDNAPPKATGLAEKRRPRPSLSERTVETLSQVSPSPSPARRRSSIAGMDSTMGPPSRPASSMRNSRPTTSLSLRPTSPTKRQFRPPGASSPTKEVPPLPALPLNNSIYTPPKAFMRDKTSRITKPLRETRRAISTAVPESHHQASHNNTAATKAQTMRVKPSSNNRTVGSKTLSNKPSLSTLFKDPPPSILSSPKIDVSSLEKKPGLMRPRSFGENSLAPSQKSAKSSKPNIPSPVVSDADTTPSKPANSSATLRETIARAKAEAAKKKTGAVGNGSTGSGAVDDFDMHDLESTGNSSGLLRKRIQGAATTGFLNIAAMRLKHIPEEVMKLYDLDPSSTISWAETVDLVKFVAADNELTELKSDTFPDWSVEEMAEDDTKANQFGGLEVLDFHNNMLQSIPPGLRRLERLKTLNLNNNLLPASSIEIICQIKSLKELSLADNQLSGCLMSEISQLENLQVLDLHGNGLNELPTSIGQLKRLRVLKLSKNKFARLPFEILATLPLVEISASNNKLSGSLIPEEVHEIATLRILDVSFNSLDKLTTLDLISLPNLHSIALDGNRLSVLPMVSAWTTLSTFTASENLLTELPAGFTDLSLLKNADFSRNNIKTIPDSVSLMECLSLLNLASNPLRERKYLTMSTEDLKLHLRKRISPPEDRGIEDMLLGTTPPLSTGPEPTKVGSERSPLHTPKNGILDLTSHNLANLDLSTIALSESTKVTTLKLSSTHLVHLPIELLTHPSINPYLQHLDLSHNPLSATEYLTMSLHLPQLLTLNIVSTGLTSLDALTTYLQAPQLRELNISCHRLTGHVPWLRALCFPNLRTLLATDNWFNSLDVEAVRGLEVLDVKNNEIEALPPKIGMLGNHQVGKIKKVEEGRLRVFEVGGNKFRVPRIQVVERGTESVLKDLRRMIPLGELEAEWKDEV